MRRRAARASCAWRCARSQAGIGADRPAARAACPPDRVATHLAPADPFARSLSPDLLHAAPMTDLLHERLIARGPGGNRRGPRAGRARLRDAADPADAKRITLALAAHNEVTGRSSAPASPPPCRAPDVASMARGALAAGGSYYYADLVADALGATGFELRAGAAGPRLRLLVRPDRAGARRRPPRGRVARLRPQRRGRGLGARAPARASASGTAPRPRRCPTATRRSTSSYAISIWSHFAERRRSLARRDAPRAAARAAACCSPPTASTRWRTPTWSGSARRSSSRRSARRCGERGFWYTAEYAAIGRPRHREPGLGDRVPHRRVAAGQGHPRWRVALFHPGRVEANQDLYVLERR